MVRAEIGFDNFRIANDKIRCTLCNLSPVVQNNDLIGDSHHKLHVMLNQHDRYIVLSQALDQLTDLAGSARRPAHRAEEAVAPPSARAQFPAV